jgi:hypothetical protein
MQRKWWRSMKGNVVAVLAGAFIAVASWAPLWIVEKLDPYAMPVGLGLLTFAASLAGGVIAVVGLVRLAIQASRAPKA